ncbi:unnamed protein product [Symbiodinium natans]|uniref:PPPDE domain-containing protein n=1 Tax=Symbiodinium natans TaxID=878477 RepID=A0A812SM36_9DINO|nr:unnamed protein product [Symbiodinium natans]
MVLSQLSHCSCSCQAIWHTALVVEWPEAARQVLNAKQLQDRWASLARRFLGYTSKSRLQINSFLIRLIIDSVRYDECHYDLLTNNCNHFTDKLLFFLLGEHMPRAVLRQHDLVRQGFRGRLLCGLLRSHIQLVQTVEGFLDRVHAWAFAGVPLRDVLWT